MPHGTSSASSVLTRLLSWLKIGASRIICRRKRFIRCARGIKGRLKSIEVFARTAPPDNGMHPARDTKAVVKLNRAAGRVMRGVRRLHYVIYWLKRE